MTKAAEGRTRFSKVALEDMTPDQRKVADAILAGPRKSLDGPFAAMLHSPAMADRLQELGAAVRFNTNLPERIRELAILLVARHWRAQFEWVVHRELAIKTGLAETICNAIAERQRPAEMDRAEEATYDFCRALLETGSVTDTLFARVKGEFGEAGAIDIIATVGYYSTVSFLLNVDDYPPPEGARLLD